MVQWKWVLGYSDALDRYVEVIWGCCKVNSVQLLEKQAEKTQLAQHIKYEAALETIIGLKPEKKVPSRTFRVRARSPDQRTRYPMALRSPRRFQGHLSNTGESTRRVNYAPLKPIGQRQENRQRASESVHVVSVQSMNPQGKSQPVYRAAVTKLKIPEDDHFLEAKDVGVRVISSQSVLVTWVDPLYEKVSKVSTNRQYTIRYREKGESARWDYKTTNTRRGLVDDLNPDAMYEFSVRISQEDNEGEWSSSVFQRTPESAPTSAPENLYVAPLNGKKTAVRATWDELSDSNGRIKEYIISYAPAMKPFSAKSVSYSGTTRSASIDGLQPGERYIFKIRAANRRGQGPQSKAFTVIMPASSSSTKDLYHQSLEKEEQDLESDSSPQSTEDLEDVVTTTAIPKTSPVPPRRRIRPFSINNPLNPARRPFRTNPLRSGTRTNGQKPSPTAHTDDENETKNQELEYSESNLPTTGINGRPNEREESQTQETKVSHLDSTSTESETSSHRDKDDGDTSLPRSPLNTPTKKGTTSIKQRNPFNRVPSVKGNSHLSSRSQTQNQPIKIKPQVIPPRKINLDSKKQSYSPLLLHKPKESTISATHESRNIDLEANKAKKSKQERNGQYDGSDLSEPRSTEYDSTKSSALSDPEKTLQDKKADKKTYSSVKNSERMHGKSKAQVEKEKDIREPIFSGHKSLKTTVGTTLKTVSPTTPLPTTTTSPTTTATTTSKPSFSGKSALSILEYYRRRSSQVSSNIGSKFKARDNSKIQPTVSVHTTTATTATTITTVTSTTSFPEHLNAKRYGKLIDTNTGKDDTHLRRPQMPSKPLSNDKTYERLLDKSLPSSSSASRIFKKPDEKLPESALTITKQKDVYDLPNKKAVEQSKTIVNSRTPARSPHDTKKAIIGHVVKQILPDEKMSQHNLKSSAVKKSQPLSGTLHEDKDLKNEEDEEEIKLSNPTFSKHSYSSPSTGSRIGSSVPHQKPNVFNPQIKNAEEKDQTASKSPGSSNLYLPSNRNIGLRRTSINKSHLSPSVVDNYLKYGSSLLTKSQPSTDDAYKTTPKPQQIEKEQTPTPSSRTRQSSYSNSGRFKHGNMNGNAFGKKSFSQDRSEKLEDEEGLSAPTTIKENAPKTPGISTSYTNYKNLLLSRKLKKATTTFTPTTSRPQSTTRVSPYRLLPSAARQLNIGRSVLSRTTPSPTTSPARSASPTHSSRHRILNSRFGAPGRRPFGRPFRQGINGRQNLTPRVNGNGNVPATSNGNLNGQRIIFGPQGTKWVVDLNRGLVLNPEGRYLQDSNGKPLRIKLGGDGRTIVDMQGTPVVSPDGLPLFGHGRFSKPVASAQDRPVLSLGGRPLRGLEVARTTRVPTTRMTTTIPTTTTTIATTTPLPTTIATTTPEPTTVISTTEEFLFPTCPPGSSLQYDDEGNVFMGPDDKPDCYEEDNFSGQDLIVTTEASESATQLDLDGDYEYFQTTLPPLKTTTEPPPEELEMKSFDTNLVSEFDVAGKKRFTAPYVSYISKDPNTPCSLTDALEHFQVDNLADILPKDLKEQVLPPQKISYNITVVAVEGCHSFVILDWAKPKKGDFITGYLVYSASYEDFLRNKWATRTAGATNFPVENLKPNTRYYFKIQATNPYGLGPVSPSVSFVTESDNPLLIVRPPGGEPIWIPFAFKHDTSFSGCTGKQYVKRTWYRKFVGVVLCNSLRYKIYLSENLRDTFYSIGDSWGRGEDHCQFVDSYMDGRTGPLSDVEIMPMINGYYRQYTQEPVMFGKIGYGTPHNYVGWYECGVPIPGKW
ncbi:fibronectin type III domain-containing protein 1 [Pelodytes ibericus]